MESGSGSDLNGSKLNGSKNVFFDCHTHLGRNFFKNDLKEVIARAQKAGVQRVVNCGLDKQTNLETVSLAREFDLVCAAVGFSPTDVSKATGEEELAVLSQIESFDAVAVGEVGLDFHWIKDEGERKRQAEVFLKILEIAEKRGLPVIIHSRAAEREVVDILESFGKSCFVMHCFTGKLSLAKRALDLGCFFSIPTNVCYYSSMQKLAGIVPLEKLLIETDSPFLHPQRGERNEPAFVVRAYETVSNIKNINIERLCDSVYFNFTHVFGVSLPR
ncbi:MAG: TatD family hydrolase [Candidatus Diapherotrites archaeon]|nr:TatD family hydrolase [Candidatus Diapherotrites archaeon]